MQEDDFLGNPLSLLLPRSFWIPIQPAVKITVCVCVSLSVLSDSFNLVDDVCQAPLSMGFSRQEYWSGLPFPPPGNLPDQGIEPKSLMSPALAAVFFTTRASWEAR